MKIYISKHGSLRAAQRNLSLRDIEYVLANGHRYHCAGALITFLQSRDIPIWDRANPALARLNGTAVVSSVDNRTVITVWRNPVDGLKNIRRKPKYSITSVSWNKKFFAEIQQAIALELLMK